MAKYDALENHLISQFNDMGYNVQKTDDGYVVSKDDVIYDIQPTLDNLNGLLLKIQESQM